MKEAFAPKRLEVIRSPGELLTPLFSGANRAAPSDRRVRLAAEGLLDRVHPCSQLLLYLEDFSDADVRLRSSDYQKLLDRLGGIRQRVFDLVSAEIPTIMVKQIDLREDVAVKEYASPARWRPLGGLSTRIAEQIPVKDVAGFRVKPGVFTGAGPFTLHTGAGGVTSPFLAEEHVFCAENRGDDEYSKVTLAPDQNHVPVLGIHFKTIPQKARLSALWHAMQGCATLHRSGFAHGDVKPDNIFWNGLDGRLFDLDFAVPLASYRRGGGGTPGYLDEPSQEGDFYKFYRHNDPDLQSRLSARDVFAFGMSLGDVFSTNPDWTWSLVDLFKAGNGPSLDLYIKNTLPAGHYRDLISEMTHPKRCERPSLSEAINCLGRLAGFEKVTF